MKKQQLYTQEQYARCLSGFESNEDVAAIAKATGMKLVTVVTYAQPKLREWVKQKAAGINIRKARIKPEPVRVSSGGRFQSAALNEIFDRLTPAQKDRFERAIIDVVLSKAFLP